MDNDPVLSGRLDVTSGRRAVQASRWLAAAALLLSCENAVGQFINRAAWLGTEVEDVRRNYDQGPDYFIDRMSYVLAPPWWEPQFRPFRDRMSFAGGSVTGDELTLENLFHYGAPLGGGFHVGADYLQSENQDTRFQRFAPSVEYDLSDPTSVFVQLEGFAEKDRSDVSFGTAFFRSETSAVRAMFTLVDFSEHKSDRFEYEDRAYALMLTGHVGAEDGFQLQWDVSSQLPFVERELESGDEFGLERTLAYLEARVPVTTCGTVVLGADFDWTSKELRPADPASPLAEDFDRNMQRVRAEWWQRLGGGCDVSAGVSWLHLHTDGDRVNDPANSFGIRRTELVFLARGRIPLSEKWLLEPQVFAGNVDLDRRLAGVSVDGFEGFQGKAGIPVTYRFSDSAALLANLSVQLDEATFGGGGVAFRAEF